jgi:endonuclease/exonuclease/phosphatase (EEP) superfamily protein YafD
LLPAWVVVAALLAVVVARVVAFDELRVLMLVDAYALWALLPALPIAVAAWCSRAWPLALAATVVVLAHLAWVLPTTARTVEVTAEARRAPHVRVVSANLRFHNPEHRAMLRELAGYDADVLALQEVTPDWWAAIARSPLVRSHPHVARRLRWDPGGTAVLSKRPLRDVRVQEAGGWPILSATTRLGGRDVRLVDVHVAAPHTSFGRNRRARARVNGIVERLPRPRLVVGDFNASPYNRWPAQLRDLGLRDAHEAVGRPFAWTWQSRAPLPPPLIDHVFADPALVALRVTEGEGPGSDHRPVVADLAVLPARRTR